MKPRKFNIIHAHVVTMQDLRMKFRQMNFDESNSFNNVDQGEGITYEKFVDGVFRKSSFKKTDSNVEEVNSKDKHFVSVKTGIATNTCVVYNNLKVRKFSLGFLEDVNCVPLILSTSQFLITDRFQEYGAMYALLGLHMALNNYDGDERLK